MSLYNKVAQFTTDADLAHDIVHGGPTETVPTEGGDVRTFAKLMADLQASAETPITGWLSQASASASSALSSKNAAETASQQAGTARDQAVAAWTASVAPAETLASIASAFHSGAIVRSFLYDTSRDSDGGQWRKRCADKSWYTESIPTGRWLGRYASITAAVGAGAQDGDYYQNTTDGKFYLIESVGAPPITSIVYEIFRGGSREFPELAAIIVESARVVIYDLTTIGAPMWRVVRTADLSALASYPMTSVRAVNGQVIIGHAAENINFVGMTRLSFAEDRGYGHRNQTYTASGLQVISQKIACTQSDWAQGASFAGLVSVNVNDIAATILPDAPTDPATGLPVPTIAVATAGGVSVIEHDGTVSNLTADPGTGVPLSNGCGWVSCTDKNLIVGVFHNFAPADLAVVYSLPSLAYVGSYGAPSAGETVSLPVVPGENGAAFGVTKRSNEYAIGSFSSGLTLIKENPAAPTKGMAAYITKDFTTGWMPGDIRRAWLADTVAGTITGSGELVTNGDFSGGTTTGWTAGNGATLSVVSGAMRVTNAVTSYGFAYQAIPTVVGKTYSFSVTRVGGDGSGLTNIGTSIGGTEIVQTAASSINFVATTSTTYISFINGDPTSGKYYDWDNISVKLAEPDRSVKNKGLTVVGTLTKTAVASGAGLVAYSGFSASNYLEQPYSSELDFGTGDFCVMGWVSIPTNDGGVNVLYERGGTSKLLVWAAFDVGYVKVEIAGASIQSANGTIQAPRENFVCVFRISGTAYIFINGELVQSGALAGNIGTGDPVRIGATPTYGGSPAKKMALWRASATAPTADQIAQIYRDELQLFQPNAQCTLAGTSNTITALAHDPVTDTLHAGTSWGRSSFRNLLRVDSEATAVGAITSLSAYMGGVITAGASAGRYSQPAFALREEIRRKFEARQALGAIPVTFDYDAVTSQTAFVLPKGYTADMVFSAGSLKRKGATKDYTVSFDGYQETVNFGVAPGNTVWVSIRAKRSV